MNVPQATEVDVHDPAGMAAWLRERKAACLEFYKLDSEEQQRHFLQRWQQHVLPHLAFRFGQAAELIERLERENAELRADAVETVQHWGGYAGSYFQEKHNLAGDIARLRGPVPDVPAEGK